MSAQDEVSVVVKCLRLGAADYLVKPLRTNELLNLWTHMWRRRRMVCIVQLHIFMDLHNCLVHSSIINLSPTYCVYKHCAILHGCRGLTNVDLHLCFVLSTFTITTIVFRNLYACFPFFVFCYHFYLEEMLHCFHFVFYI